MRKPPVGRRQMIQAAQAKLLRRKAHREPDADERGGKPDFDADDKKTGSISSAGASVGGGT